jgi:hypothetical protein
LTPELRAELAETLGLPESALAVIPVGFHRDTHGECWTFREVDATGRIVGISRRYRYGTKKRMHGGNQGLVVPRDWLSRIGSGSDATPLFCPEGPSDTAALTAMGLPAIGRPSNTGGIEILAGFLKQAIASNPSFGQRPIIVLGEYDANAKGQWPGRDGATKTARGLADANLGRPIKWALPPDKCKDVREWVRAQKFDPCSADSWSDAGEAFAKSITPIDLSPTLGDQKGHIDGDLVPAVQTIDAISLLAMDLPESRCVIPGYVAEGLNVLAGKPKLGKSWMALNMSIAVATGGVALGQVEVSGGDVLYVGLEDTLRRQKSRLQKLLQSQPGTTLERLELARAWPRQDKGGLFRLMEWLESHPSARLVCIDTWGRFRPARNRSSDSYEEDYQHASELKALADKYGVAILAIHHCRKMSAADPFDEVSGTLGLTGAADATLVLRRERGDHDATLFVTGRDLDEQETALRFDKTYALWTILGDAEKHRLSKERQDVIDCLMKSGKPMAPSELATLLDKKPGAAKKLLWTMATAGQLSVKDGLYGVL